MKGRPIIFWIVLLWSVPTLNAQETDSVTKPNYPIFDFNEDHLQNETFYTSRDGRFVFSFANDSVVQTRFYVPEYFFERYRKIPYHRVGDTVILHNSSLPRVTYTACNLTKEEKGRMKTRRWPVVVKYYGKYGEEKNKIQEREFLCERFHYLDSTTKQVIIPADENAEFRYSDIIVMNYLGAYVRLHKEHDTTGVYVGKDIRIDVNSTWFEKEALFNDFPLVIKGDEIYPVDDEKNYQCWIDNGFLFPVLTKAKIRTSEAEFIHFGRIGIMGMKQEF